MMQLLCIVWNLHCLISVLGFVHAHPPPPPSPAGPPVIDAWKRGSSWRRQQFNLTSPLPLPLWGSYRPGIYFGMKTRTSPHALNTGIMWTAGKIGGNNNLRHEAKQDELDQFHWMKHDGKRFGMELLRDEEFDMTTTASFVVPTVSTASWAQRLVVESLTKEAERKERGVNEMDDKTLLFYFGTEGMSTTPGLTELKVVEGSCNNGGNWKSLIGKSKQSGWFRLELSAYPTSTSSTSDGLTTPVNVTYFGGNYGEVSVGARQLQADASIPTWTDQNNVEDEKNPRIFDNEGRLKNHIDEGSTFISFAVQSQSAFAVDVVLYEHVNVNNIGQLTELATKSMSQQCTSGGQKKNGVVEKNKNGGAADTVVSRSQISEWITQYAHAFDTKFERIFQLHEKKQFLTGIPAFGAEDVEVGRKALSAVLGGIGYFYGEPRIGNALDSPPLPVQANSKEEQEANEAHFKAKVAMIHQSSLEIVRGPPIALLTGTPSRTSFPRGFLWDEGYHQMVISQWDVSITLQVLADWLSSMYHCSPTAASSTSSSGGIFGSMFGSKKNGVHDHEEPFNCSVGGWIPREMILGSEAEKRVPDEFITQRVDIANPPTLMLVIESLLDRITTTASNSQVCMNSIESAAGGGGGVGGVKQECDQALVMEYEEENRGILLFLQDSYPALHEWVTWLRTSQKGGKGVMDGSSNTIIEDTFRWRGRIVTGENKLITNTLASGLDDYPRSPLPSDQEFHVDLFCWILTSARIMSRLEQVLLSKSSKEGNKEIAKKIASIGKSMGDETYDSLATRLESRLEFLHWSPIHKVFADVGYSSDLSVVITDLAMRCGNEESKRAVDIAVPLDVANSGNPFCPPEFPKFIGGVSDGDGGVRSQRRFTSPEPLKFQHIPRIGYLSLFPFLLKILQLGNPRLDYLMDIMESTDHLWTEHGLRSLSKNDTFYHIGNAPGDEPYWRGPIWININYLAIKALKHYIAIDVESLSDNTDDEESDEIDENIPRKHKKKKRKMAAAQESEKRALMLIKQQRSQQQRMELLYHRLRENIQKTVLSSFHTTGYFWEHYDDDSGHGTRGHPFSGWTTLILNIMAEI